MQGSASTPNSPVGAHSPSDFHHRQGARPQSAAMYYQGTSAAGLGPSQMAEMQCDLVMPEQQQGYDGAADDCGLGAAYHAQVLPSAAVGDAAGCKPGQGRLAEVRCKPYNCVLQLQVRADGTQCREAKHNKEPWKSSKLSLMLSACRLAAAQVPSPTTRTCGSGIVIWPAGSARL